MDTCSWIGGWVDGHHKAPPSRDGQVGYYWDHGKSKGYYGLWRQTPTKHRDIICFCVRTMAKAKPHWYTNNLQWNTWSVSHVCSIRLLVWMTTFSGATLAFKIKDIREDCESQHSVVPNELSADITRVHSVQQEDGVQYIIAWQKNSLDRQADRHTHTSCISCTLLKIGFCFIWYLWPSLLLNLNSWSALA